MRSAMDMNAVKNHCEWFEFAVTTYGLFMIASEGLIGMEEIDFVEDYPLLEYTAPSEGQALHAMKGRESKVLHVGWDWWV